jgi:hypothetical protein
MIGQTQRPINLAWVMTIGNLHALVNPNRPDS